MKIANLATLRGRSGMTQSQLALASGISQDTISKLETGSRGRAHAVTAKKLALGLGVELSELISQAEETDSSPAVGRALSNPAGRYFSLGGSAARKRTELFEISRELDEQQLNAVLNLSRSLVGGHSSAAETGELAACFRRAPSMCVAVNGRYERWC